MIPFLSTALTVLSSAAVGWGLATGDILVLAPGLVALVCALPLQALSYRVHEEGHVRGWCTPQEVLWHSPYNND